MNGLAITTLEGWINADVPAIQNAVKALEQKGAIVQHESILIHSDAVNAIRASIDKLRMPFINKIPENRDAQRRGEGAARFRVATS